MLNLQVQKNVAAFAKTRRTIGLQDDRAEAGLRRYRFSWGKLESVILSGETNAGETVWADLQEHETLLPEEQGIEWRRWGADFPGDVDRRFFPWSAVQEIRATVNVVLETRDPSLEETERCGFDAARWHDADGYAEDWRPADLSEVDLDAIVGEMDAAMFTEAGFETEAEDA